MPRAGSAISIPTKLLATGVACALAVVVCGTAASVVVASEVSGKQKAWSKSALAMHASNKTGNRIRDLGATRALIDSLVAPLGHADSATSLDLATLIGYSADSQINSTVWDTSPLSPKMGPPPKALGRRGGARMEVDSLEPAWIESAVADTSNEWIPLFRRLARTSPLPALWGIRAGLPGLPPAKRVPHRSYDLTRRLFAANEGAAILSIHAGRYAEAATRARENIAASRHFLEQPLRIDALSGNSRLRRGLRLLMVAAERGGDSVALRIATKLDSATHFIDVGPRYLAVEMEDPESQAADKVIADRSLHPATRIDAMSSIVMGGCRNTPEVVLGFKDSRREALYRAVESLSDIPRGREVAQQNARYLEHLMSEAVVPADAPPGSILDRSELFKLFSWIVPPGVRARARLCLGQG